MNEDLTLADEKLVDAWLASGLNRAAFARQQQIPYHQPLAAIRRVEQHSPSAAQTMQTDVHGHVSGPVGARWRTAGYETSSGKPQHGRCRRRCSTGHCGAGAGAALEQRSGADGRCADGGRDRAQPALRGLAMLNFGNRHRIVLAQGATDMRKTYDTLAALVADALGSDPYSGDVFVFVGACGRGPRWPHPRCVGCEPTEGRRSHRRRLSANPSGQLPRPVLGVKSLGNPLTAERGLSR